MKPGSASDRLERGVEHATEVQCLAREREGGDGDTGRPRRDQGALAQLHAEGADDECEPEADAAQE